MSTSMSRTSGVGTFARRAVLLLAAGAVVALATTLGGAFAEGYQAQTTNSGEFVH